MKKVKKIEIEHLYGGIALHFLTDEGDIVSLRMGKKEARELMKRIFRMLGFGKGDTGVDLPE